MRSRFFPIYEDENLLNRFDLVLKETGGMLSMDIELRHIIYLSNSVEQRVKKRVEMNSYRPLT